MTATSNRSPNWEDASPFVEQRFVDQDGISTESQQRESPEWDVCVDALLKIWSDQSTLEEPRPTRCAIESALIWVAMLRRQFPTAPPTCIIPEPNGGIIVERRGRGPNGIESVCELTFYNNEHAERTDYLNGRLLSITPIVWRPRPQKIEY